MPGVRVVVHPAHLRVAVAMAELIGEPAEVEVVTNRHVPVGDIWLMSIPELTEVPYDGFGLTEDPSIPLTENRALIIKIA